MRVKNLDAKTLKAIQKAGTFGSALFIKKTNGERRYMRYMIGVKKGLDPDSKGLTENQKASDRNNQIVRVLEVFPKSMDKNPQRRSFSTDTLLELKAAGIHIKRDELDTDFEVLKGNEHGLSWKDLLNLKAKYKL